jgi:type IV secretion system protein VirB10
MKSVTSPQSFLWAVLLASAAAAQQPATQQSPPAPAAQKAEPAQPEGSGTTAPPRPAKIVVPEGTKLPLVLHNSVTTRNAKPGDAIYLETLFPITQDNHIIIPAGSYVQGEILEAKRTGKVKGVGELRVRLNTMILPNGYTVSFNAVPTNAGTGGNESVEEEDKVKGDSDKAGDVGTVVKTTGAGAGIGAIAGRSAKGAGIGAGAGAAVGLATVLLTRGPELELPRGTTLDVVLDRPLYLDADKVQFTDPGHASTLPGPPNREPQRNRVPF